MAALRSAARRILGGQAPRPVYRAIFAEERQRLLPAFIRAASSAHPRRFSSQSGDNDPLTFEQKMGRFKRCGHLILRTTKAVSTIVACGIVIKWSLTEIFYPGYLMSENEWAVHKCREMLQSLRGNPPAMEVGPVLDDEMLAAKLAEFKSMVKDREREAAERLED